MNARREHTKTLLIVFCGQNSWLHLSSNGCADSIRGTQAADYALKQFARGRPGRCFEHDGRGAAVRNRTRTSWSFPRETLSFRAIIAAATGTEIAVLDDKVRQAQMLGASQS
ncbi:hypothetical protein [Bradyrhizobium sp. Ai1a-2]|uniref:hypothetical protein n=1 Tax=Bradyrhizobium sp. Ai1a-2 TaxID=196490 RepID=UPI00126802AF|nr:hypothetical protein [Bradyrhizobium sp. Ai1a-2]